MKKIDIENYHVKGLVNYTVRIGIRVFGTAFQREKSMCVFMVENNEMIMEYLAENDLPTKLVANNWQGMLDLLRKTYSEHSECLFNSLN